MPLCAHLCPFSPPPPGPVSDVVPFFSSSVSTLIDLLSVPPLMFERLPQNSSSLSRTFIDSSPHIFFLRPFFPTRPFSCLTMTTVLVDHLLLRSTFLLSHTITINLLTPSFSFFRAGTPVPTQCATQPPPQDRQIPSFTHLVFLAPHASTPSCT